MLSDLKNIKTNFIPILEWSLIRQQSENNNLRENFKIKQDFEIIATDLLGDIIVKKDSKLYSIDHDDPEEEGLLIINDIPKFEKVLDKIMALPQYSVITPLSELRQIKKELLIIQNEMEIGLRSDIEQTILDLKELISDWKFYQTDEGKRYLTTESFKENFYSNIRRPERYHRVEVEREFESNTIKIIGVCEKEDESKEELETVINGMNCKLPIEFGKFYTFEEYKLALEKHNSTNYNNV
jgi:hypothetical protein